MELQNVTIPKIEFHQNSSKLFTNALIAFGVFIIALSLIMLFVLFRQVIILETKYNLNALRKETGREVKISKLTQPPVQPVDKSFSIIVPKIDVNTKVLPNIDPYNKSEYDPAMLKGAAHAKGTALPGEKGNVFIFAHSVQAATDVERYNAVFYLLGEVKSGDEIFLVYRDKTYKYKVTETLIINPEDVQYLENSSENKTLTLMTCWPAGVPIKRLLVVGKLV